MPPRSIASSAATPEGTSSPVKSRGKFKSQHLSRRLAPKPWLTRRKAGARSSEIADLSGPCAGANRPERDRFNAKRSCCADFLSVEEIGGADAHAVAD